MKRALMATGAALLLAAATFTVSATPADAQKGPDGARSSGGGSGGGSARGSGGRGRAAISGGGGGQRQFSGGGGGGQRQFSGGGGGQRQFSGHRGGGRHIARHHRRGGPVIAFGSPYYYNYGYSTYAESECYEWQRVMTAYGWRTMWVNVCYE